METPFEAFIGLWCTFPTRGENWDAIKIGSVEEIGTRYGGVPYIRFRAAHDLSRVIELLGAWALKREWNDPHVSL